MDTVRFRVEYQHVDRADVINVIGGFDFRSAERLSELLSATTGKDRRCVVLDLTRCALDAVGITSLADLPYIAGLNIRLVTRDPFVKSMLHVAAVDAVMPIYPTVAEALSHAVL